MISLHQSERSARLFSPVKIFFGDESLYDIQIHGLHVYVPETMQTVDFWINNKWSAVQT